MSILRELAVRLGLDVNAQDFAKGNLAAEGIKVGLEAAVNAARQLASTFVDNIQRSAEYGEQVKKLSSQTGISTDTIQRLGKAAASEGIEVSELGHSLVLMSRMAAEAIKDSAGPAAAAYHKLGISTAQLRNAKPDELFLDIADGIAKLPEGAAKGAIAMGVLGRSGYQLVEVLEKGRAGLAEFLNAPVLTPEQIQAGKDVVQTERALTAQTAGLWRSAVGPLMPAIRDLLKEFLEWKKANAEIMRQNLTRFMYLGLEAVKLLGAGFRTFVGTLRFFSDNWRVVVAVVVAGITGWAVANMGLVTSFVAVQYAAISAAVASGAAWLLAAAPFAFIAGVILGILGLFDDLRVYAAGGDSLFGRFVKNFQKFESDLVNDKGYKPWWLSAIEDAIAGVKLLIALTELWHEREKAYARAPFTLLKNIVSPLVHESSASAELGENPSGAFARFVRARAAGEGGWKQAAAAVNPWSQYATPTSQPWDVSSIPVAQPMASYQPVTQSVGNPSITLHQTVNALPGMDAKQVADLASHEVGRIISDHIADSQASASYNEP